MRTRNRAEIREYMQLRTLMLDHLAQMATLPYGTVMNYNATGGGKSSEHPGGRRPTGEHRSVEDEYTARWNSCKVIEDARECVKAAEAELDGWRHSKAQEAGETTKQLHQRIVRVGEGWLDRECAAALRQTMATVHEARAAFKRDAAKGLPLQGADAAELLRRGNTYRYVAGVLNKSSTSVYAKARKKAA
jgi:hypothetical protein